MDREACDPQREADWEQELACARVGSAVQFAKLRTVALEELIGTACDVTAPHHHPAQRVLAERGDELTDPELLHIQTLLNEVLAERRDGLTATEWSRTHRLVNNVGVVLPALDGQKLAQRHLGSKWAARRQSSIKLLRTTGVDGVSATLLVRSAQRFGDVQALELAARVHGAFSGQDCCTMFSWIGPSLDQYTQAVVLTRMLSEDVVKAEHPATEHPRAFLQAVGRLPLLGRKPTTTHMRWVRRLIDTSEDVDTLLMAASVCGRLRRADLVARLESRIAGCKRNLDELCT